MQKNTLILTFVAVMTLFFMPPGQAQSSNDSITAKDIKKETQDLLHTLQQYTVDQRDQAVKEADQALKKLDERIDKLESRVDNNWDKMTQAARQKARDNLQLLRQQRNELAEWYGGFKYSSKNAWQRMKQGFTDAYQTMSDSWQQAKREFERDNE